MILTSHAAQPHTHVPREGRVGHAKEGMHVSLSARSDTHAAETSTHTSSTIASARVHEGEPQKSWWDTDV